MLKPTASFKMRKHLKWTFSGIHDAHLRGAIKRSMIDAQLASEIKVKDKRNKDRNNMPVAEEAA
jgi:hypothetical protein